MSGDRIHCQSVAQLRPGHFVWVQSGSRKAPQHGVVLRVGKTIALVRFVSSGRRPRFDERWFGPAEIEIDPREAALEVPNDPYVQPVAARRPAPAALPALAGQQLADGTCLHGLSGPCPECEVPAEVMA